MKIPIRLGFPTTVPAPALQSSPMQPRSTTAPSQVLGHAGSLAGPPLGAEVNLAYLVLVSTK